MTRWKAFIPVALALAISIAGSGLLYKWLKTQTAPRETVIACPTFNQQSTGRL